MACAEIKYQQDTGETSMDAKKKANQKANAKTERGNYAFSN